MKRILLAVLLTSASTLALAGPTCTDVPKDKWMPEAAFQKQLTDQGYQIKKFKVTSGQCYEIYGMDKAGAKVEIYCNPVDGKVVKAK